MQPATYRRLTLAALVMTATIIVTGAAVRLTGSGLGCSDWPKCEKDRLVAPAQFHAVVEFVNRVFTGVMGVALIVAILASLARQPRRRDLTWLSVALAAGVVGQALVGALVVKTDLNPSAVILHFLLSMVMVAAGMVLHQRASEGPGPYASRVTSSRRLHARLVVGLAAVTIVAGTVVTGTGPHGGDERARRFGFEITQVARVHSGAMWLLLLATVLLAVRVHGHADAAVLARPTEIVLAVIVAQGAVGYLQYALDVPPGLVAIHVAGSVALWIAVWRLLLATRRPSGADVEVSLRTPVPART